MFCFHRPMMSELAFSEGSWALTKLVPTIAPARIMTPIKMLTFISTSGPMVHPPATLLKPLIVEPICCVSRNGQETESRLRNRGRDGFEQLANQSSTLSQCSGTTHHQS